MGEMVKSADAEKAILAQLNDPKVKAQLGAALPNVGIRPDTFARWCVTALRRQPALLLCDRSSLLGAMVQSAQLGLDPSGATGQAYLLPFGKQVTFVVGYKGLISLAYRGGQVGYIDAHVVHANDQFSYAYGLVPKLNHVPANGERGALQYAYAIAKVKGGEPIFTVLTAADIDKIKASSASARASSSPWNSHPDQMWLKSAVRRLCKLLPLSTEALAAVGKDEDSEERGIPPIVSIDDFTVTDVPAPESEKPAEPAPAKKANPKDDEFLAGLGD
jgi:recombination protein RecT